MAILKSLRGIEVSICVDDEPLVEYDDRNAQIQLATILKYVKVVPDKEFVVKITIDRSYKWTSPGLHFRVKVDGTIIECHNLLREEFEEIHRDYPFIHESIGAYGTDNGEQVVSPFKFSKLHLSENEDLRESVEDDATRLEELGEVEVAFYRIKSTKQVSPTDARRHWPKFEKSPALKEKLDREIHLEALHRGGDAQSHITTLGPSKPADIDIWDICEVKYMDYNRQRTIKPRGTFKLRYRSEEALKNLLIIRWDNAAIKSEPVIKIESDDENEAVDVAEDVIESPVPVIKREHDEDMAESSITVSKRARLGRRKK